MLNGKKLNEKTLSGINGGTGARRVAINQDTCICCGSCYGDCMFEAIDERDGNFYVNDSKCTGCGNCTDRCPTCSIDFI